MRLYLKSATQIHVPADSSTKVLLQTQNVFPKICILPSHLIDLLHSFLKQKSKDKSLQISNSTCFYWRRRDSLETNGCGDPRKHVYWCLACQCNVFPAQCSPRLPHPVSKQGRRAGLSPVPLRVSCWVTDASVLQQDKSGQTQTFLFLKSIVLFFYFSFYHLFREISNTDFFYFLKMKMYINPSA